MPKTIEQRWKVVGVKRDDAARALLEHFRKSWSWLGNEEHVDWDKEGAFAKELYRGKADALLPLIEKAVWEGRKDELETFETAWGDIAEDTGGDLWPVIQHLRRRIRELEAGE